MSRTFSKISSCSSTSLGGIQVGIHMLSQAF